MCSTPVDGLNSGKMTMLVKKYQQQHSFYIHPGVGKRMRLKTFAEIAKIFVKNFFFFDLQTATLISHPFLVVSFQSLGFSRTNQQPGLHLDATGRGPRQPRPCGRAAARRPALHPGRERPRRTGGRAAHLGWPLRAEHCQAPWIPPATDWKGREGKASRNGGQPRMILPAG